MSTGFSGSDTRGLSQLEREIEYRLGRMKHMDVFTDDFSPPGSRESVPGSNPSKPGFVADAHTDQSTADDNSRNHSDLKPMAAAGNAREQGELDNIDYIESKHTVGIKTERDQFPGSKPASDSARFDSHQTDPARLAAEVRRDIHRSLSAPQYQERVKDSMVRARAQGRVTFSSNSAVISGLDADSAAALAATLENDPFFTSVMKSYSSGSFTVAAKFGAVDGRKL